MSADTRYYDIVAQSRRWDREIGQGSYCVHVERIAGGSRPRPNLMYALERAHAILAVDRRSCPQTDLYYDIVSDGRVYATVTDTALTRP